jgi:hypothetical protein
VKLLYPEDDSEFLGISGSAPASSEFRHRSTLVDTPNDCRTRIQEIELCGPQVFALCPRGRRFRVRRDGPDRTRRCRHSVSDACVITHGWNSVVVVAGIEECHWQDQATGNEWIKTNPLPDRTPAPVVVNRRLSNVGSNSRAGQPIAPRFILRVASRIVGSALSRKGSRTTIRMATSSMYATRR